MQIEGAFVQGLGWVALEELKWGDPAHKWIPPGYLYTCGPGNYKIPSLNDVPFKFNVSLLKVCLYPYSVRPYSSANVNVNTIFGTKKNYMSDIYASKISVFESDLCRAIQT